MLSSEALAEEDLCSLVSYGWQASLRERLTNHCEGPLSDKIQSSSTRGARRRGPVAQLAEQQTLNLRVEGSIPSRLTTLF